MWIYALDYLNACTLDDTPAYYWYKENSLAEINGTFDKDTTTITSHNFTESELSLLTDINSFSFQNIKILTIGMLKINIHPINNSINTISGHTIPYSAVLIEYDTKRLTTTANEEGLFEIDIDSAVPDNTRVKITSCLNGCYTERKVNIPFNGELTLLKTTENIPFSTIPVSYNPIILHKKNMTEIRVVDSRINSTKWKLYINYVNPMISGDKVLIDSLKFKKFDNELINLTTNKQLVYESNSNNGNVEVSNITFSTDKGLIIIPNKNLLMDEDYCTLIIWSIEE